MFLVAKLLLLAIGMLVAHHLPRWQAKLHFKLITRDGKKDSLHERFHVKWALIRFFILAGTGFAIHFYFPVLALYYLGFAGSYFGLIFTRNLNRLRGREDYYVSRDPRASYTDRTFASTQDPELTCEVAFKTGNAVFTVFYFAALIHYLL